MRMRTIDQAITYLRDRDPETAITKNALRQMVKNGDIPSVQVGRKRLIALETLDERLLGVLQIKVNTVP